MENGRKVFIQTFGCQMNKLDSELIAGSLLEHHYKLVDTEKDADVILLNTCSVRQHAEERVYSRLSSYKKLKQTKPHLILGLIGCMAQKDKAKAVERIPHLDIVCGPHRYQTIVSLIEQARKSKSPAICTDEKGLVEGEEFNRSAVDGNTHTYIQVMRGCNNFCSYCIVPYVRGKEISRPPQEIINEIVTLVSQGVKEITLLGQNVTAYKPNLSSLLKKLSEIEALSSIGFLTCHPSFVDDELLETMRALPKIKRELQMPAQSGSDRILKAMNRKYTARQYLDIIAKAYHLLPDVRIISDFIVGFPGETEENFQKTVNLIKEAKFYKIYVFKYSSRPGTAAEKLQDDVPPAIKSKRNNYLLELQRKLVSERRKQNVE
ncbi:MAG: tRNA (N6-isopentenyl adenosine(37)-C2)-methylthiotransferase MiaB [Planctomycetes bacterium]|nr:tRNA (N6-isopentenyl adenosine(37)-C2)-methylthiotransferase MiaB [Planctomycetota bacterium]